MNAAAISTYSPTPTYGALHLKNVTGLYVAEFHNRVKLGVAASGLRARLRTHARAGALRMLAYPAFGSWPRPPARGSDLAGVERYALRLATARHEQVGRTESFVASLEEIASAMREAIAARRGGPVHEIQIPIKDLL